MRINEIITESLDEETLDEYSYTDRDIHMALKAKGYKYLGSGVDQTAFVEPKTGLILKIFGTDESDRFSDDHKMFFKWYKFCSKHQDNPFLPRFYGHDSFFWPDKHYPDKKHRYLMIRTEPLKDSGATGDVMSRLATRITDGHSIPEVIQSFKANNPRSYQSFVNQYGEQGLVLFFKTVKSLYLMGERAGWSWDLHYGNIMVRKDGTPIINDPWVA